MSLNAEKPEVQKARLAEMRLPNVIAHRREVLKGFKAGPSEVEELLTYNENSFKAPHPGTSFPLPDEPFVAVWDEYVEEAAGSDVAAVLRRSLVQLAFPIRKGISEDTSYRAATRRGVLPDPSPEFLYLDAPKELSLALHQTLGGRVPILIARHRTDFESLVRAFLFRNEPQAVPRSMGAAMISGYNNWDRVRRYRARWEGGHPGASETMWQVEFSRLIPRKELYQDRFIILSDGPYSGVPAAELGLDEARWKGLSLVIRREHECAHYFTRRVFASMRNRLLDELIADYSGIVSALGHFREDWFLRFMGLEDQYRYRNGGRLENYRGDPPLSDKAFAVLQRLVRSAAKQLAHFDHESVPTNRDVILCGLATLTLEELAGPKGEMLLRKACREWE